MQLTPRFWYPPSTERDVEDAIQDIVSKQLSFAVNLANPQHQQHYDWHRVTYTAHSPELFKLRDDLQRIIKRFGGSAESAEFNEAYKLGTTVYSSKFRDDVDAFMAQLEKAGSLQPDPLVAAGLLVGCRQPKRKRGSWLEYPFGEDRSYYRTPGEVKREGELSQ